MHTKSVWYGALVATIFFYLFLFGYGFCSTRLRFYRTLAIGSSDFGFPTTDTFNTAKWWFMVIIPLSILPLVPLFMFLRLQFIDNINILSEDPTFKAATKKITGAHSSGTEPHMRIKDTKQTFQTLHTIICILALGLLITDLVFIGLDFDSCNSKTKGGGLSTCSDIGFCCATDVLPTPPGVTPGCPYIFNCAISPPVSTSMLKKDYYFIGKLVLNVILIVMVLIQLGLNFFLESSDDDDEDELLGDGGDDNDGEQSELKGGTSSSKKRHRWTIFKRR